MLTRIIAFLCLCAASLGWGQTSQFAFDLHGELTAQAAEASALPRIIGQPQTQVVIPGTSAWWLEHYTEFATYLERRHVRVAAEDRAFVVYRLQASTQAVA